MDVTPCQVLRTPARFSSISLLSLRILARALFSGGGGEVQRLGV